MTPYTVAYVIGQVTIRLSIVDFLYVLNTHISLYTDVHVN